MRSFLGSIRPDATPLLSSTLRRLLAAACLLALPAVLAALTAYFSGAVATLGNGFNSPLGVAVDSVGDVFFADDGSSTVKEIVAVNGKVSLGSAGGSGFSYLVAWPWTVRATSSSPIMATMR